MKFRQVFILLVAGIVSIWVGIKLRGLQDVSVNVVCETTKGPLKIVVMPEWSPDGAERFLKLVDDGFYSDLPIFRCVDRFLCQFGSAPPRANIKTYSAISDDPPLRGASEFKSGYLSFAGSGPNSRSTHVFIALAPVKSLGSQPWETPFGYVTDESMKSTVAHFTTSYGETSPIGKGPEPRKIEMPDGAEYLKQNFPLLDSFLSCSRKK